MQKLNIAIFKKSLDHIFSQNLLKQTRSILANILALDFLARLEGKLSIDEHIDNVIQRLKNFIKTKVFIDDGFGMSMMLFTIAISEQEDGSKNLLDKKQNLDVQVDIILNTHLNEYHHEEKERIKLVLREILSYGDQHDFVDYIGSNPKEIKKIFSNILKKEELSFDKGVFKEVLSKNINLDHKIQLFKQSTAQIATIALTLAAVATTIATCGLVAPLLVVPVALISMKFSPKFGENLGEALLNIDQNVKNEKLSIKNLFTNLLEKSPIIDKVKDREISISDIMKSKNQELSKLKEELSAHINNDKIELQKKGERTIEEKAKSHDNVRSRS